LHTRFVSVANSTNNTSDPRRFEVGYRIRFDEAGGDGCLPPSGFVRYAQDVAWQHSDARGFDRAWYGERGVQWLVRWVDVELVSPAQFGSTVLVSTRVIGGRRALARRRAEVRSRGGDLHAVVLTDWILVTESGRPARVPAEIGEAFSDGETFAPGRVVLGEPPADAARVELRVRPQDLDPMRHVNNARYLDFVDEVLGGPISSAKRYTLEFLRPAAPDEILAAASWRAGDAWSVSIAGAAADQVLRATVES
jgi:acyl-CoA thioesterase FadM